MKYGQHSAYFSVAFYEQCEIWKIRLYMLRQVGFHTNQNGYITVSTKSQIWFNVRFLTEMHWYTRTKHPSQNDRVLIVVYRWDV